MKFFSSKETNSFLFILLILVCSCNYKPLLNKDNLGQLNFKTIEISGDKRIAQIIVNKLNIKKDQTGNLDLFIRGKKNTIVSNKSITGKVLEYNKNNVKKKPIVPKKIPISTNDGENIVHADGK